MTPKQCTAQSNPIWLCDLAETRILASNDAACRFLGRSHDSIAGLAPADIGLGAPDGVTEIRAPGGAWVAADLHRDSIRWGGEPDRALSVILRPQAMTLAGEDSPAKRTQLMQRLMIHNGCAYVGTNPQTGRVLVTPQLQVMFGLDAGGSAGGVADIMPDMQADDLQRYLADRKAAAENGSLSETVVRLLRKAGDIRHINVTVGTDADSGGREFGMVQDAGSGAAAATNGWRAGRRRARRG
jgi:PAS domain-containing protein